MRGSVSASSPDRTRNFSGTQFRMAAICATLPEASLMPAMLVQALLRRLVVIRCDRENATDTQSGKPTGTRDDIRGVVATGASENGHSALGDIEGDFNNPHVFFIRERGALAGSAARDKEVDAGLNLALDQRAESAFTDGAIDSKWRNERCPSSSKHILLLYRGWFTSRQQFFRSAGPQELLETQRHLSCR